METSRVIDMISELVACPSVSSVDPRLDQSNRPVIELLATWLEDLDFRIRLDPVPDFPEKFNLVAVRGEGPGGLVLSGHTDTVPYDEDHWSHDPFQVFEADQRLYGLGTADMKSFFALVIEALRGMPRQDLRRPLTILATADEESGMCGAQALVQANQRLGNYAVIGEPTGLRPVRLHKGILMEAIRLRGRSGHSSDPSLGINALEGMYQVIGEILTWRQELQNRYQHPAFKVPVPTLNLGHIHGGDNPNRICGDCELHIDLRPIPGMSDVAALREELRTRLAKRLAGSGLGLEVKPLFPGIPPVETSATSAIVKAAEELTGQSAGAVAFATEAPFLTELGMETLILGAGNIEQAHQPDEYLELAQIQPAIDLLRGLIERICRQEPLHPT